MINPINKYVIAATLLALSSCTTIQPITFETVEKVKVDKFSLKPSVDVNLKLNNPNTIGLKIKNIDMKINAFDKNLGEVTLNQLIKIPKQNDFVLPLTFDTTIGKAIKLLPKTLGSVIDGKKVKMEFKGSITVKKWFFQKTFPFKFVEEVDPKKIKSK